MGSCFTLQHLQGMYCLFMLSFKIFVSFRISSVVPVPERIHSDVQNSVEVDSTSNTPTVSNNKPNTSQEKYYIRPVSVNNYNYLVSLLNVHFEFFQHVRSYTMRDKSGRYNAAHPDLIRDATDHIVAFIWEYTDLLINFSNYLLISNVESSEDTYSSSFHIITEIIEYLFSNFHEIPEYFTTLLKTNQNNLSSATTAWQYFLRSVVSSILPSLISLAFPSGLSCSTFLSKSSNSSNLTESSFEIKTNNNILSFPEESNNSTHNPLSPMQLNHLPPAVVNNVVELLEFILPELCNVINEECEAALSIDHVTSSISLTRVVPIGMEWLHVLLDNTLLPALILIFTSSYTMSQTVSSSSQTLTQVYSSVIQPHSTLFINIIETTYAILSNYITISSLCSCVGNALNCIFIPSFCSQAPVQSVSPSDFTSFHDDNTNAEVTVEPSTNSEKLIPDSSLTSAAYPPTTNRPITKNSPLLVQSNESTSAPQDSSNFTSFSHPDVLNQRVFTHVPETLLHHHSPLFVSFDGNFVLPFITIPQQTVQTISVTVNKTTKSIPYASASLLPSLIFFSPAQYILNQCSQSSPALPTLKQSINDALNILSNCYSLHSHSSLSSLSLNNSSSSSTTTFSSSSLIDQSHKEFANPPQTNLPPAHLFPSVTYVGGSDPNKDSTEQVLSSLPAQMLQLPRALPVSTFLKVLQELTTSVEQHAADLLTKYPFQLSSLLLNVRRHLESFSCCFIESHNNNIPRHFTTIAERVCTLIDTIYITLKNVSSSNTSLHLSVNVLPALCDLSFSLLRFHPNHPQNSSSNSLSLLPRLFNEIKTIASSKTILSDQSYPGSLLSHFLNGGNLTYKLRNLYHIKYFDTHNLQIDFRSLVNSIRNLFISTTTLGDSTYAMAYYTHLSSHYPSLFRAADRSPFPAEIEHSLFEEHLLAHPKPAAPAVHLALHTSDHNSEETQRSVPNVSVPAEQKDLYEQLKPVVAKGHILLPVADHFAFDAHTHQQVLKNSRRVCCVLCTHFFSSSAEYSVHTECHYSSSVYRVLNKTNNENNNLNENKDSIDPKQSLLNEILNDSLECTNETDEYGNQCVKIGRQLLTLVFRSSVLNSELIFQHFMRDDTQTDINSSPEGLHSSPSTERAVNIQPKKDISPTNELHTTHLHSVEGKNQFNTEDKQFPKKPPKEELCAQTSTGEKESIHQNNLDFGLDYEGLGYLNALLSSLSKSELSYSDKLFEMDFPPVSVEHAPTFSELHSSPAFTDDAPLLSTDQTLRMWPLRVDAQQQWTFPGKEEECITPLFAAHDNAFLAATQSEIWSETEYRLPKALTASPNMFQDNCLTPDEVYLTAPSRIRTTHPHLNDMIWNNVVMVVEHKSDKAIHNESSLNQLLNYLTFCMISQSGRPFIYGALVSPSFFVLAKCEYRTVDPNFPFQYFYTAALPMGYGGWWYWRQLLLQPLSFHGLDYSYPISHSPFQSSLLQSTSSASSSIALSVEQSQHSLSFVSSFNPISSASLFSGRSSLLHKYNNYVVKSARLFYHSRLWTEAYISFLMALYRSDPTEYGLQSKAITPVPLSSLTSAELRRAPVSLSFACQQLVMHDLGSPLYSPESIYTDFNLIEMLDLIHYYQNVNTSQPIPTFWKVFVRDITDMSTLKTVLFQHYIYLPLSYRADFGSDFNYLHKAIPDTSIYITTPKDPNLERKIDAILNALEKKIISHIRNNAHVSPPTFSTDEIIGALEDIVKLHSFGLCHRDISPFNITLFSSPATFSSSSSLSSSTSYSHRRAYLIDFGGCVPLDSPFSFYGDVRFASSSILTQLSSPASSDFSVAFTRSDELQALLKVAVYPFLHPILQSRLMGRAGHDINNVQKAAKDVWDSVHFDEKLNLCGFATLLGDLPFLGTDDEHYHPRALNETALFKSYGCTSFHFNPVVNCYAFCIPSISPLSLSLNQPSDSPILISKCAAEEISMAFSKTDCIVDYSANIKPSFILPNPPLDSSSTSLHSSPIPQISEQDLEFTTTDSYDVHASPHTLQSVQSSSTSDTYPPEHTSSPSSVSSSNCLMSLATIFNYIQHHINLTSEDAEATKTFKQNLDNAIKLSTIDLYSVSFKSLNSDSVVSVPSTHSLPSIHSGQQVASVNTLPPYAILCQNTIPSIVRSFLSSDETSFSNAFSFLPQTSRLHALYAVLLICFSFVFPFSKTQNFHFAEDLQLTFVQKQCLCCVLSFIKTHTQCNSNQLLAIVNQHLSTLKFKYNTFYRINIKTDAILPRAIPSDLNAPLNIPDWPTKFRSAVKECETHKFTSYSFVATVAYQTTARTHSNLLSSGKSAEGNSTLSPKLTPPPQSNSEAKSNFSTAASLLLLYACTPFRTFFLTHPAEEHPSFAYIFTLVQSLHSNSPGSLSSKDISEIIAKSPISQSNNTTTPNKTVLDIIMELVWVLFLTFFYQHFHFSFCF